MFIRGQDVLWNTEWIWVLPFSKDFKPANPFIDLFSNRGGSYLVKPSRQAIDMWDAQKQNNGIPYDARGKKFTYNELGGQPVIMKYIYNYLDPLTLQPVNFFEKQGQWFCTGQQPFICVLQKPPTVTIVINWRMLYLTRVFKMLIPKMV
jgi:hypothetical protein